MTLPHRRLGRTGLEVSAMGLGAAPLGELFEKVSDDEADAVVAAALDEGFTLFDTAPWYGHGLSEHRIGRPLRALDPASYVLSTKVGRVYSRPAVGTTYQSVGDWVGGLRFDLRFDYGANGIMRSYEDSLQRLGLSQVDLLVIHDLDSGYHDPVALAAHRNALESGGWAELEALRASTEIAGIGAGINDHRMMGWFLDRFDLDFFLVAMPYTLLDQAALKVELARCAERDIAVVIGAPFASGLLAAEPSDKATYGYAPADAEIVSRARSIAGICAAHGVPLAAAALQFPLAHPTVAAVIPGATRTGMVTENAASLSFEIPDLLWQELIAEGFIDAQAPVPACGWQNE